MRKVILILLCIALYAPNIVQFFSYTKCTIVAANSIDQKICDCLFKKNDITSSQPIEKKNHQIIKETWKYVVPSFINFHYNANLITKPTYKYLVFFPSQIPQDIFRPPIA